MATSGKVVEVLCPNGRRQKVKINPSMTVLQVLQEVCEKQHYVDTEYDLKHQRKILNVTSMMRFLNLPNNAKLELVNCEKPRLVSNVTVALQLEDGTRYQGDFDPDTSLLNVLKTLVSDIGTMESNTNLEPVCVYMRNEYRGVPLLTRTTLKTIGVSTGRVAIRLLFRDIIEKENAEEIHCEPSGVRKINNSSSPCELKETSSSSLEPNGKKIKLGTKEDVVSSPRNSNTDAEMKATSNDLRPHDISTEGSAYASLSIIGAPPRQIFPDDCERKVAEDNSLRDEPSVIPSVGNEFANFKFPDVACTNPEPVAIDPHLIKKEVKLGMPCARHPIIFSMERELSVSSDQEPDDSFFQVTIDDLRKRLSDLKSERKGMEEDLLMTSAMREQRKMEKISNFDMIPVRLMLPGKLVLQGIFRPLETIGVIKEFLNGFLLSGIKKSELFVTPPRVVLKDKNQTLYDAKLFPAAVVHVSFDNAIGPHLKQECLDNLSTSDEAEAIVDKILKRRRDQTDESTCAKNDAHIRREEPVQNNSASTSASSNRPANVTSSQSSQRPKGAPKWFKTGR